MIVRSAEHYSHPTLQLVAAAAAVGAADMCVYSIWHAAMVFRFY